MVEYLPRVKTCVLAVHAAIPVVVHEMRRVKRARIEQGMRITNMQTMKNLEEWCATGCFRNEQHFHWAPPLVEETRDLIIIHEQFRML